MLTLDKYFKKYTGGYGPAFRNIYEDAPRGTVASIFMVGKRP